MSGVTRPLAAAQFDIDRVIDQVERDRSLPIRRSLRGTRPIVAARNAPAPEAVPAKCWRRLLDRPQKPLRLVCTWHVSSVDCVGRDGLDLDLQGGRWESRSPDLHGVNVALFQLS